MPRQVLLGPPPESRSLPTLSGTGSRWPRGSPSHPQRAVNIRFEARRGKEAILDLPASDVSTDFGRGGWERSDLVEHVSQLLRDFQNTYLGLHDQVESVAPPVYGVELRGGDRELPAEKEEGVALDFGDLGADYESVPDHDDALVFGLANAGKDVFSGCNFVSDQEGSGEIVWVPVIGQ
ncbi:hypothetical protein VTI74DRAFT_9075 [Chaetomium olivicolor]